MNRTTINLLGRFALCLFLPSTLSCQKFGYFGSNGSGPDSGSGASANGGSNSGSRSAISGNLAVTGQEPAFLEPLGQENAPQKFSFTLNEPPPSGATFYFDGSPVQLDSQDGLTFNISVPRSAPGRSYLQVMNGDKSLLNHPVNFLHVQTSSYLGAGSFIPEGRNARWFSNTTMFAAHVMDRQGPTHEVLVYGGECYTPNGTTVGGCVDYDLQWHTGRMNTGAIYNSVTGIWQPLESANESPDMLAHFIAATPDKFYFFGRQYITPTAIERDDSAVWIYERVTKSWRKGTSIPTITGAWSVELTAAGVFHPKSQRVFFQKFIYDMKTETSTFISGGPDISILSSGVLIGNDRAFYFGGARGNGAIISNEGWIFSFSSRSWVRPATTVGAPSPRQMSSSVYLPNVGTEGSVMVRGGTAGGNSTEEPTVYLYNIAEDHWTSLPLQNVITGRGITMAYAPNPNSIGGGVVYGNGGDLYGGGGLFAVRVRANGEMEQIEQGIPNIGTRAFAHLFHLPNKENFLLVGGRYVPNLAPVIFLPAF